jgi:biotin-(acetyl-CoA carboxylase) ligase
MIAEVTADLLVGQQVRLMLEDDTVVAGEIVDISDDGDLTLDPGPNYAEDYVFASEITFCKVVA